MNLMKIISGVLIATFLSLIINIVSAFLVPKAEKRKKIIWCVFAALIVLSIVWSLIPDNSLPPISLANPPIIAQSVPTAEQLDAALRSCAGQQKIDVDADVIGAIKEAWEGNVLRGKAKVDQFGHIVGGFQDENLRFKAFELYHKCLKDYLDRFSRGQHSQTSKQQKTAYDFNGCWQTDDTQDKRFIEAKSDRKFSATRQCWSKGIGGGDAFMKLCLSSSGCEARPAKGEPARAGSKPGVGLGNKADEA